MARSGGQPPKGSRGQSTLCCAAMGLQPLLSLLGGGRKGRKDEQAEDLDVQHNDAWQTSDAHSLSMSPRCSSGDSPAETALHAPQPEPADSKPTRVTQHMLKRAMQEVASAVKDWKKGEYTLIKTMQMAERNHGRVDLMQAPWSKGSAHVAVKRMPMRWMRMGPKEFEEQYPTTSERPWVDLGLVKELNKLAFPYACELLDVFRDQDYTFVATSLATDGDLFTWCDREPRAGPAREEMMQPIVTQIFDGVRWLHEFGIAHRDLSLENILLTDSGSEVPQVKIIDFGMSTLSQFCRREVRGKQSYQAPEMHSDPEYDAFLTDSFALGVVLFAMAAQDYPWTSTKRGACALYEYVTLFGFRKFLGKRKLRKGNGEYLSEVFSPALIGLLSGQVEANPRNRVNLGESCYPSMKGNNSSVFNTKWLSNLDPKPWVYCHLAGG